ncbi:MAG: hypothetical protein JJU45_00755 [Acidimicrobiia bacterium]|nr:hypothetical protein [Acidimicrobiia bacterium]
MPVREDTTRVLDDEELVASCRRVWLFVRLRAMDRRFDGWDQPLDLVQLVMTRAEPPICL